MTVEEQLVAYAAWCGISVDELMSYMDCFEAMRLVGLTDPGVPAQEQIGWFLGRGCAGCHRLRQARYFALEPDRTLHRWCVDCCTCSN